MSDLLKKYGVPVEDDQRETAGTSSILAKYGVPPQREANTEPPRPKRDPSLPWYMPNEGSWWDAIKSEATKPLDPSAKAMVESLGYAGGLTRNAVMELVKRGASFGTEGLGADEWKRTLKGQATPMPEQLRKSFGLGPVMSNVVGLPGSVVLDPAASALSGGIVKGAGPGVAELATNAGGKIAPGMASSIGDLAEQAAVAPALNWKNALIQNAAQPVAPLRPIGTMLKNAGRKIYGNVFRRADADTVAKYGRSLGDKPLSDLLWNEIPGEHPNPLVGGFKKSNPEIGDQITGLRKDVGSQIGQEIKDAGGGEAFDLAPNLEEGVVAAQREKIASKVPMVGAKGQPLDPAVRDQVIDAMLAEQPHWTDHLKKQLAGPKQHRQEALDLLKEHAPDFAETIEKNSSALTRSGDKEDALRFFNGLVDDLSEGPRTLDEWANVKTAMQNKAARNQQMGADIYARNRLPSTYKSAEASGAADVGDVIDQTANKAMDDANILPDLKLKYAALKRGEWPMWKEINKAEAAQPLSKLDMLMMAIKPHELLPMLAAKAGSVVAKSPRMGTGTGMLLNNMGKSSVWDNMLRQNILDSFRKDTSER